MTNYPNSWYLVAWSKEVAKKRVKTVHYFGQDLVIFRGVDGVVQVLDPYCPHLGAHLGVGGKVVGNCLRCPFHGWHYDGTGKCVKVPYAKKVPPKAQVKSWPTKEIHGMIFIYYHSEGKEPDFEIPQFSLYKDKQWSNYNNYCYKIKTHIHEMNENLFDDAHFVYIHRFGELPRVEMSFNGPFAQIDHYASGQILGKTVKATVKTSLYGAGYHINHVQSQLEFMVLVMKTPINKTYAAEMLSIVVKKKFFLIDKILEKIVTFVVRKDVDRDRIIWENKIFRADPVLCSADARIPQFRRWHSQFYSNNQGE